MNPATDPVNFALALNDGSRWSIGCTDASLEPILRRFARAMQLDAGPTSSPQASPLSRRLQLTTDSRPRESFPPISLPAHEDGLLALELSPAASRKDANLLLNYLGLAIARDVQVRGGILLHAALAERDGRGALLIAPGGTGKTTASERLPPPWNSLCDDTALVVRDAGGIFHAHPWPTWSRFAAGGPGGSWNVRRAVPLAGLFVLSRAPEDGVERIGAGQTVSLLLESARQAGLPMTRGMARDEIRRLHLERFNNLCALANAVPGHILRISLTGPFWREIDRALSA